MRVVLALASMLALASGCGSGTADSGAADLAVPAIDIGGQRPGDLAIDCPPVAGGFVGNAGACAHPDSYCGPAFEESCHCNVQSQTWYCCWTGQRKLCPTTPPSGTDCCVDYVGGCSYACSGGVATVCSCTDDAWHCTTVPCD